MYVISNCWEGPLNSLDCNISILEYKFERRHWRFPLLYIMKNEFIILCIISGNDSSFELTLVLCFCELAVH